MCAAGTYSWRKPPSTTSPRLTSTASSRLPSTLALRWRSRSPCKAQMHAAALHTCQPTAAPAQTCASRSLPTPTRVATRRSAQSTCSCSGRRLWWPWRATRNYTWAPVHSTSAYSSSMPRGAQCGHQPTARAAGSSCPSVTPRSRSTRRRTLQRSARRASPGKTICQTSSTWRRACWTARCRSRATGSARGRPTVTGALRTVGPATEAPWQHR